MSKQRVILIIGIALGLLAVLLINVYLSQQRQSVQEQAKKALAQIQANQTAVLVARQDIPRGAVIGPEILETKIVPNQYLQPQAVTSLDRISGMTVIAPISKGEQISLSKLSSQQAGSLSMATPVGKRAVSIAVDNIAGLGGMLKAGDYVDVIAMVPVPVETREGKSATQVSVMPLFQNILILAVGQHTSAIAQEARYKKEEKAEVSPLITLALSPQEANLIAFVQEQGKIRLSLRSPTDSQIQPVQPANWDTLFQYVMPKKEIKPEETPVGYVEVYRGLTKEKVPLYK